MNRTYGKIVFTGGRWVIEAEPHVMVRAKRVFAKLDKFKVNQLSLADTPENCRDLEWFTDRYPLLISPTDRRRLVGGSNAFLETILRLEEIVGDHYRPPKFEMKIKPREYQARAAALHLAQGQLLLCDDLGLGKTCSAITTLTDARTLPAAVVVYPHLQRQWAQEVEKFTGLTAHIVKQGTPYALPQFMNKGPDVLILTYHKLAGWGSVVSKYCNSVIFDEVQELRKSGSAKAGAAREVAAAVKFRMGLTATPIYNYGGEMFNILSVLKPDCLGTWDEFCREWCVGFDRDKARVQDPVAFGTYLREQFLMLRRTRKDVGRELPPVIRIPHEIDADAEELENISDAAAALARTILRQGQRFRGEKMQAAGEFDALMRQATGIAKAPYVAEFVRLLLESEQKVILCGWHRAVYDIWAMRLGQHGIPCAWYTGSESPAAKEAAKEEFVHGDARVLLLSLRAGAGLNELQDACKTIVFGELDWSPGVHEQCIGRLHRDGQAEPVMAYFLVSDSGADPIMADVIGLKTQQMEGIRDVKTDLIERLDRGEDNIKRLAEAYLRKAGTGVPVDGEAAAEREGVTA